MVSELEGAGVEFVGTDETGDRMEVTRHHAATHNLSFLQNGCWLFSTEISLHAGHWIFFRYWSCLGTRILWAPSSIRSSGPGQANLLHYSRVNDEPIFSSLLLLLVFLCVLCWCVLLFRVPCWQNLIHKNIYIYIWIATWCRVSVDFRADSCVVRVTGRRRAAEPYRPWEWERTCSDEGRVRCNQRRWLREREWPRRRPPGPARLRSSTSTLALRPSCFFVFSSVLGGLDFEKRGSSSPSTLVLYRL